MNDEASSLLQSWKEIIDRIVHFEYDCSFEWRGETDGSHDSYLEDLEQLQREAGETLGRALSAPGADRASLLGEARELCMRCEREGGWGSSRCRTSIAYAEAWKP